MKTDRLMAFTDGVVAIAITIMVIDLHVPDTDSWQAIKPAVPLLATYALAYVNIAIFWINHHHMLATASRVNGRALWANLFLLFWLTLMPFVIRWIGLAGVTAQPVAAYGVVTVMAAFGYILLERELILAEGTQSRIRAVVGAREKEWISFALYGLGIPAAFVSPWLSISLYIAVSVTWLMPDRRFERWHNLQQSEGRHAPSR
ncbi:TMEM175 family protein [Sphingomonas japonica]|uniref:Membrane protein n=1 Tax=Sphingomonas japonica TaxID=511662 RepID=A0ABX0TYN1_9SPHN|nr:TMEM175 family protein [Sphingomonas japonica]NIJ23420.1 putative membrane protein [Sphingomonas japonica]